MAHKYSVRTVVLGALFSSALIKLASFVKASFIIGSYTAFFTGTSVATPLVGAFAGSATCLMVLVVGVARWLLFSTAWPIHCLAYCVPGFFASLYWSCSHAVIRLVVPLLCMLAFVAHPVGAASCGYALYWLIPIVLYYIPHRSLFLHSLGSTFVAHAVGSVIWLYTVPMPPEAWRALIPIVAFERLLFAAGMTVMYCFVSHSLRMIRSRRVGILWCSIAKKSNSMYMW